MHHNCFISNFRTYTSLVSPRHVEAVAGRDKKITVNMMWRPDVCYFAATNAHTYANSSIKRNSCFAPHKSSADP